MRCGVMLLVTAGFIFTCMGPRSATAQSQLVLSIVGGPDFSVEQAVPTDPNVISIPAGDKNP